MQGIISDKHFNTFLSFLSTLEGAGYVASYSLMNAADYEVHQDRSRVFIVGFLKELNCTFKFPKPVNKSVVTLQRAVGDITVEPRYYSGGNINQNYNKWFNHDVFTGPFDVKFMARNRVRS